MPAHLLVQWEQVMCPLEANQSIGTKHSPVGQNIGNTNPMGSVTLQKVDISFQLERDEHRYTKLHSNQSHCPTKVARDSKNSTARILDAGQLVTDRADLKN